MRKKSHKQPLRILFSQLERKSGRTTGYSWSLKMKRKNIEHTKACPQQPSVSPVSFSATLQPASHPNLSHNGGYLILAPKIKMSTAKHFAFMNICSVSCEKHFSDETYANNYGHWVTKNQLISLASSFGLKMGLRFWFTGHFIVSFAFSDFAI